MLVLMRRRSEAIMIGDEIVIRILGIKGQQVRMGIEAPITISVDREEIYLKKKGLYVKPDFFAEEEEEDDDNTKYFQTLNYLHAGEEA